MGAGRRGAGLEVGSLLEEYEKLAQPARRGVLSRGPISTNLCFYVRGRTWLVELGRRRFALFALGNSKNTWPSRQTPAPGLKAKPRYVIYLFKAAIGQETTIKHTF